MVNILFTVYDVWFFSLIANLSLSEIRCMYFKLKNEVFIQKIGDVILPDSQTEILENILKKEVGEHTILGSQTHPRYTTSVTDSSHYCCHTQSVDHCHWYEGHSYETGVLQ